MFCNTNYSEILLRLLQFITWHAVYLNKVLVKARLNELLVIQFMYLNTNYCYMNERS